MNLPKLIKDILTYNVFLISKIIYPMKMASNKQNLYKIKSVKATCHKEIYKDV